MLNVNSKTNLMIRKDIEDSAFWYLELAEKGALRLKNCKFSEYLCTDRFLFHVRGERRNEIIIFIF